MFHTYKGINIYYKIVGKGKIPIVFLHGWGGNTNSFLYICKHLTMDFRALFIDFPPFGNSDEPTQTFDIFDYANMTREIITINNFENCNIVAHSFGGRVATILASEGIANKLILTASAGMKVKRSPKYYIKVYWHKLLKKIGITSNGGSADYKQLSTKMKKTFVNIVNTNLEKYAININVPTILFWGKNDKDTPFYMAKRLKKLIKNSEIVSYNNCGHFCYLEKHQNFVGVINSFFGE